MNTINDAAGSLNPLRNQAAAQKQATGSAGSSKERQKRVETGQETPVGKANNDTVEIKTKRPTNVDAVQGAPENEAEAAALLEQIQNHIQREDQQQLEQLHNMSGERVIEILT